MQALMRLGFLALLVAAAGCKQRELESSLKDGEPEGDPTTSPFFNEGAFTWEYDAGPDPDPTEGLPPQNPLGRELIDLHAGIPSFPGLSVAIYGDQMFRPAFGPIPWRMQQKPNSVKILFIGQDGTHIAEAANRPATAGFGGRAQDLAKYFGVGPSAAFINAYAFTIRWQYGAFDTPYVSYKTASPQLSYNAFVGNPVWLISQDLSSPLVKWRNDLIAWIIRNNRESLKMIVLFGGASRDAMAQFVNSRGGEVGSRFTKADVAKIKIPEFSLAGAGSNKQTVFPLTRTNKDLYREFNNNILPKYTDPNAVKALQTKFRTAFNQDPSAWLKRMVIPGDADGDGVVGNGESAVGLNGSGMIHEAQLGGFDIDNKMKIGGQTTISLRGLKIADDYTVDRDILVTQLPHPTALSMMNGAAAAKAVKDGLVPFIPYATAGWAIEPDKGFANKFALHAQAPDNQTHWYKYARGDMGTIYYDFGAPNSRMVNVSTASRSGKDVIIFGTREKPTFNQTELKAMRLRKPSKMPPNDEQWIARASSTTDGRRYTFDPGPLPEIAKVMKSSLPQGADFVKKRDVNGDFGHYRGTFKDPQVVVIADPHGYDDLNTSRALTGSRGQYLHAVLESMGVGAKYLVIKTAPYSQDGLWTDTVEKTKGYRDAVLGWVFQNTSPSLIIADGAVAAAELERINPSPSIARVTIQRQGNDPLSGIAQAVEKIKQSGFPNAAFANKMSDLPRSHLTYYARVWEGTSGDRVITATGEFEDKAFAVVAPEWAYKQVYKMPETDVAACKTLIGKLNEGRLRAGEEPVTGYINRIKGTFVPTSSSKCSSGASGDVEGGGPGVAASAVDDEDVDPVPLQALPTEDKNFHLPFDEPLPSAEPGA